MRSTGLLQDRAVSQYRRRNVSAAVARASDPGMTRISSTMPNRPARYGTVPPAWEKTNLTSGVRAKVLL